MELGDLEDLYYATCGKLKDLVHGAHLLLANGFKAPQDELFQFDIQPLQSLGPVKLGDFNSFLLSSEMMLHSEALTRLLDQGIMNKSMRETTYNQDNKSVDRDESFPGKFPDTQTVPASQIESLDHSKQNMTSKTLPFSPHISRLRDMGNMSCGMIFAELAEKYGPMTTATDSFGDVYDGDLITTAHGAPREIDGQGVRLNYISPYNLNERAKKLDDPNGPEMPCLCDPECICAPLCASDTTQNCLCEENALFVRVTEGMNIDDLDVPDLVRPERCTSSHSQSSKALSDLDLEAPPADWPKMQKAIEVAMAPMQEQQTVIDDFDDFDDLSFQHTFEDASGSELTDGRPPPYLGQFQDIIASGSMELKGYSEFSPWEMPSTTSRRISGMSYREALRQPFAKRCDTPPRHIRDRNSITKRLFGSGGLNSKRSRRQAMADGKGSSKASNEGSLSTLNTLGVTLTSRDIFSIQNVRQHEDDDVLLWN